MRSVLFCQHDAQLVREVMPRWLNSFTELVGIVVIRDQRNQRWKKLKRSLKGGLWGTLDLLAYRVFHRLRYGASDRLFESQMREAMGVKYAPVTRSVPVLETGSPNGHDVEEFLRTCRPDMIMACCKHILKPTVFEQATLGTFVMHPGICPEYRNAHGCFWALVNRDFEHVGMTLLKIDRGIDTGPVLGYFTAPYNEKTESHLTIQRRMTYSNLDGVRQILDRFERGESTPLSTAGRKSAVWGQPTLTSYLRWKLAAQRQKPPISLESKQLVRQGESMIPATPLTDGGGKSPVPQSTR